MIHQLMLMKTFNLSRGIILIDDIETISPVLLLLGLVLISGYLVPSFLGKLDCITSNGKSNKSIRLSWND